ncbi:hypothetical protein [Thermodesulfovibrio yellowstonii]|uniref:hypothetical protein n=1 Tax=Thermodesulfovibrio yellowstonii TaxID=28262 RepID=UPI00040687A4|nr:hypothetical protein [Thermodesulfovibrio islandicus]
MTKRERLKEKEKIAEIIKQLRAQGVKYEQMALELGLSVDTLRRFLYCQKIIPAEITIRRFKNWLRNKGLKKCIEN